MCSGVRVYLLAYISINNMVLDIKAQSRSKKKQKQQQIIIQLFLQGFLLWLVPKQQKTGFNILVPPLYRVILKEIFIAKERKINNYYTSTILFLSTFIQFFFIYINCFWSSFLNAFFRFARWWGFFFYILKM